MRGNGSQKKKDMTNFEMEKMMKGEGVSKNMSRGITLIERSVSKGFILQKTLSNISYPTYNNQD